jgi:endonuclease V-like protein UPF0215 family
LKSLKKEIRVLGLALQKSRFKEEFLIVGAVFRGRRGLDGVMRTKAFGPNCTKETIEMITNSPHYPQIRAVLLRSDLIKEGVLIDPLSLHQGVSRPVIAMNIEKTRKKHLKVHPKNIESSISHIGLKKEVAAKIVETTSNTGSIPEALKVAYLILSELIKKNQNL